MTLPEAIREAEASGWTKGIRPVDPTGRAPWGTIRHDRHGWYWVGLGVQSHDFPACFSTPSKLAGEWEVVDL